MSYLDLKNKIEQKLDNQKRNLTTDLKLSDLPPLNSMLNLEKGAKLLVSLLEEGQRVLVVGDYDADGIMGTTILYGFLTEAGFTKDIVDFYIPSRLADGYGLSPNVINYAINNNFDVIVTVDNGIAAVEAIKMAKDAGLKVIVTDHHTAPAILPEADVLINPKQPGETFPFINISGATVAWYFASQLRKEWDLKIDMRKYLDLVALTIMSDVMPLDNINLPILKYGLQKMKDRTRYIYELCWDNYKAPVVDESTLSFSIIPMINAIGRINDANLGVELFLSRDKNFINREFNNLVLNNENRKELTRKYTLNAEEILSCDLELSSKKVIVIKNKGYHEGIVGIIAGKLAEKYQVPAYVFTWSEEKELWKGSGRSVGNVHLYDLTNKVKEFIYGFGGHKGAIGIGIKEENFENFKSAIEKHAENINPKDFINDSLIPIECSLEDFNFDIVDLLESYGPFGECNPKPIFKATVKMKIERELKDGLHYKMSVTSLDGNVEHTGMFFYVTKDEFLQKIKENETHEILFYPTKNYNPTKDTFGFDLMCNFSK